MRLMVNRVEIVTAWTSGKVWLPRLPKGDRTTSASHPRGRRRRDLTHQAGVTLTVTLSSSGSPVAGLMPCGDARSANPRREVKNIFPFATYTRCRSPLVFDLSLLPAPVIGLSLDFPGEDERRVVTQQ